MTTEERALALLKSGRAANVPYQCEVPGKRLVGFVVDSDVAELSAGFFALDLIKKAALEKLEH